MIDPVRRCARPKQADWHIPIRPGTDGALALAMINVIIAEDLIDSDYVEKYTVGYDELKERAQAVSAGEGFAAITGIPAEDIRKLAREYATTQPSVIRIGVAVERHAGGGQASGRSPACRRWWARGATPAAAFWLHADLGLPGEVGRADAAGLDQARHACAQPMEAGRGAYRRSCGLDPPIKSLFVYNSNPMVVAPDQE